MPKAKCDCKDQYQDKRYGDEVRVHTPTCKIGVAKATQDKGDLACCRCGKRKPRNREV